MTTLCFSPYAFVGIMQQPLSSLEQFMSLSPGKLVLFVRGSSIFWYMIIKIQQYWNLSSKKKNHKQKEKTFKLSCDLRVNLTLYHKLVEKQTKSILIHCLLSLAQDRLIRGVISLQRYYFISILGQIKGYDDIMGMCLSTASFKPIFQQRKLSPKYEILNYDTNKKLVNFSGHY